METHANTTKIAAPGFKLKQKVSARTLKMKDFQDKPVVGKLLSRTERTLEQKNEETGEITDKTVPVFRFESPNGDLFRVDGDAGLIIAMESADIGCWYQITRLAQIQLAGAKKLNQYDVIELEQETPDTKKH